MIGKRRYMKIINKKLDKISLNLEKSKLIDYVYYLENPRKLLLSNFISGLSRGFGMAVGFTLLGAVAIYILQMVVRLRLPVLGKFISDIVDIVQDNMDKTGGRS